MDDADRKAREIATLWLGPTLLRKRIATALREAEQRGMMRAENIVRTVDVPSGFVAAWGLRDALARAIERVAKEEK